MIRIPLYPLTTVRCAKTTLLLEGFRLNEVNLLVNFGKTKAEK